MKPRKLRKWVLKDDIEAYGMKKGDVFTIEGEFVDRWFDPYLRQVSRFGRMFKWYFYWKWRM